MDSSQYNLHDMYNTSPFIHINVIYAVNVTAKGVCPLSTHKQDFKQVNLNKENLS